MKHLTQPIKDKYYTFILGEFLPVYDMNGELINRSAFHKYKARRAVWKIRNLKETYHHYTNTFG